MLVNINGIAAENVKQLSRLTYSQSGGAGLKDFPVLVLDRYSGITGLTIWAGAGENNSKPGECYSAYIGAFCPISNQIMFLADVDHDYVSVSMSGQVPALIPVSYKKRRKGSIIIQNDVWIGYGVTILSGVMVHNGAVIAANSTVTKDVPPYAIVAGNPARVIKYRFDAETIERLQRIQWWYWDEKTIKERRAWFQHSPEEFAKRFDVPQTDRGGPCKRFSDAQLEGIPRESLYLVFADLDDPYSMLLKIIKEFSLAHTKDDWLVVALTKDSDIEPTIQKIYEFAEGIDSECGLYVRLCKKEEIPALISSCETLITSRVMELVRYTCIADLAGTKITSGVDIPIF